MAERKKPNFRREDRTKKVRLKGKWRKPKGIHSKMRHGFRGRAPTVNSGYRQPEEQRGTNSEGKHLVIISQVSILGTLSPKTHAIIIDAAVGGRKRLEIIAAAQKASFSIANIKDASAYVSKQNKRIAENKERRSQLLKQKESKKSKKQEKPEEKAEEKTPEQKKEEERAEKEKVLTQRT